jgi:small basic protein
VTVTEQMTPYVLPLCLTLVAGLLWGGLTYAVCRLEMGRENSWSVVVAGFAVNIIITAIWVFAGPV